MLLDEIAFSSVNKDVRIDQREFRADQSKFLKHRLPFTIDVAKKDGQPVSLIVAVTRIETETTVNLIDDDTLVGRLYLAKPDIFPGAFYVASMALLPDYQGQGIGPLLYNALIQQIGVSLVGYDQSPGAQKMWGRVSKSPGNAMYAVMPTRQNGNMFFKAAVTAQSDYVYTNYDNITKPIEHDSRLFVVMTKRGGKMDGYIKQHMKLMLMRRKLSQLRSQADPFADHFAH